MKRAIAYIRVSTSKQVEDGCSLEMQAQKISAYAELNDLDLSAVFSDEGISAKNIKGRPGFQAALSFIYSGQADALVVYKLDRAFRSTRDALDVAETLNKRGKGLHSITEKLDTTSAIGEFFFTLMASLAQMERRLIGERTRAAMGTMKDRNERVGEIPFGMRLADDGVHLEAEPTEQQIIERIHNSKANGYSFRQIAKGLNRDGYRTKKGELWGHSQVSRIFQRLKNAA